MIAYEFGRSQKILALGENSHDYAGQYLLLNGILKAVAANIDYIGFEISSEHQRTLDTYLAGTLSHLPKLNRRILSRETRAAFEEVLRTVKRLNQSRAKLIQVLALDQPESSSIDPGTHWLEARDPYAFQVLAAKTNHFEGRGILFLGAAHLARYAVPTPKIMQKMMKAPLVLTTLGELLEREENLKGRIQRVWIDSPILAADRFAMVPPDWDSILTVGNGLSNKAPALISTADERFLDAESKSITRTSGPFRISENFGYYIRVEKKFSVAQQCKAWLNPLKVFGGIMMRWQAR